MIKAKSTTGRNRIYWLDLARASLVLAMIAYHFYWDLVYFHMINETPYKAYLSKIFAHAIAAGFLFISGFSIVISSQGNGFFKKFLWRLWKILSASLVISYITYLIFPQDFIYFGILHQIALSSILIVCLLRANYVIDFLIAIAIFTLTYILQDTNITNSLLPYLGLTKNIKPSVDFVPIFPWTAFSIIGSGAAKLYLKNNSIRPNSPTICNICRKITLTLSKYSLLIYLLHQPILFGALYFSNNMLYTPNKNKFIQTCTSKCKQKNSQKICKLYCTCMQDKLTNRSALKSVEQAAKFCQNQSHL